MFVRYGADPDPAAHVAQAINRDPETALRSHLCDELGVDPSALPSPLTAAVASLVSCTRRAQPAAARSCSARTPWPCP